jgi:selenide,water dikinase
MDLGGDDRIVVPPGDDAGVYRLGDVYVVQTIDVITPVLNDPFLWGSVSAANSLSDVYAMGGRPLTALAFLGFDPCGMKPQDVREVLKGAVEKLKEAGVVLLGGHTMDDREPKFGLAVFGVCERPVTLEGARPGQILVITKPVGTGSVIKGVKEGLLREEDIPEVIRNMTSLNDKASRLMLEVGATSCTDVTGFGLLGHAWNICRRSRVGMRIYFEKVPVYRRAVDMVRRGLYPRGALENLKFVRDHLITDLEEWKTLVLTDPVTSGGLLFTVDGDREDLLRRKAEELGVEVWVIGEVTEEAVIRVL